MRRGAIYCSPACGGNCTWEAYRQAEKRSKALCENLGSKWKPRVWENLGWHYRAEYTDMAVYPLTSSGRGGYDADIAGHFIGRGRTPIEAADAAMALLGNYIRRWQKVFAELQKASC